MRNIGEPNDRSILEHVLLYINIIIEEKASFGSFLFFERTYQILKFSCQAVTGNQGSANDQDHWIKRSLDF